MPTIWIEPKRVAGHHMKGYILVETLMGKAGAVTAGIRDMQFTDVRLLSADAVTGPFDVVVIVETTDLETLIREATDRIQGMDGVRRTITCLAWPSADTKTS